MVKDVDGEPIAYANVIFKDSYEGTITNEEGRFYMESDETYQYVIFSFIGFAEHTSHWKPSDCRRVHPPGMISRVSVLTP